MISIDGSLLVQVVNFLFLIWALNLVLYRPLRNILRQRNERISGLQQGTDGLRADMNEKDRAYLSGLKAARAKGLEARQTLIQAATDEQHQIIERISQRAQKDLVEVKEKIANDAEDVRQALLAELDDFADAISNKILGRVIS
jgi:F-type H+-transporting ATPase subunit b